MAKRSKQSYLKQQYNLYRDALAYFGKETKQLKRITRTSIAKLKREAQAEAKKYSQATGEHITPTKAKNLLRSQPTQSYRSDNRDADYRTETETQDTDNYYDPYEDFFDRLYEDLRQMQFKDSHPTTRRHKSGTMTYDEKFQTYVLPTIENLIADIEWKRQKVGSYDLADMLTANLFYQNIQKSKEYYLDKADTFIDNELIPVIEASYELAMENI